MTTAITAERGASGTRRRERRDWKGWAFVGPFMVVFALVFLTPLAYALYLSFFQEKLIGGNAFVGLDNYVRALTDSQFWEAFGRVLIFLLIQVPIMLVLALGAALALDSARLRGASFFRILIFLPYAVPAVVAVLMWGYIYGDQFGLTANFNDFLGFDALTPFAKEWMLVSIGNIVTWEFVGYNMLIFYSSLKSWKLPMIEKMLAITRAPRTDGILIEKIVRHAPAPSREAASYMSFGIVFNDE